MLRYCLFTGQLQESHGKRINFLKCVVYLYLDTQLCEIGTFKCEFLQKKKKQTGFVHSIANERKF